MAKQPEVQQQMMQVMMPKIMAMQPEIQQMTKDFSAQQAAKAAAAQPGTPAPAPAPTRVAVGGPGVEAAGTLCFAAQGLGEKAAPPLASGGRQIIVLLRSAYPHDHGDWELPESAATPEGEYRARTRRDFLKTAGLGIAGAVLSGPAARAALAGFPSRANPDYPGTGLKVTPYNLITSYNNFYEFGMDKGDPSGMRTRAGRPIPGPLKSGGLRAIRASGTWMNS